MFQPYLSRVCLTAFIVFVLFSPIPAAQQTDAMRFWPQWRGPHATGVSPTANPPLEWSETKNIRWKVEIPGRGISSPIVWGDRVFVLTAVPVGVAGRGAARAARRPAGRAACTGSSCWPSIGKTGRTLWERVATRAGAARSGSHRQRHLGVELADHRRPDASSPTSSRSGMYAYDMDGTLLWKKDLGDKRMRNQFGEGIDAGAVRQPPRRSSGIT